MSIKLKIKVHTDDAEKEATQITKQLKDKNLRGVKVRQAEAEPEDGQLDIAGYLPLIETIIQSGLATAFVVQLFSLLKNGFFTKSKEIASAERIKTAEIEANKEIEIAKLENEQEIKNAETGQKRDYIELVFECGEKKMNFKLTKDDPEQQKQIMQAIMEMQNNCE